MATTPIAPPSAPMRREEEETASISPSPRGRKLDDLRDSQAGEGVCADPLDELEPAATSSVPARSATNEMADDVRWIRSYILDEPDGTLGTVCIYQATGPEAVREHAKRSGPARR